MIAVTDSSAATELHERLEGSADLFAGPKRAGSSGCKIDAAKSGIATDIFSVGDLLGRCPGQCRGRRFDVGG